MSDEEARRRLQVALDAGAIAIWVLDIPAQQVFGDANLQRFFHVTEADTHGGPLSNYLEAVHPEDLPAVQSLIEKSLQTGENYEVEYRVGPEERWVVARGKVVRNAAGAAERMNGVVLDITDRKLATAALRISEERYRDLFNSIDQGFCVIEMIFDERNHPVDYRFIEVNPAFEKQTGMRDAVGKRMREFVPNHEERWFEEYGAVAITGKSSRFEQHAAALGRWFELFAFRVGEPAQHRVAVLFSDITARKIVNIELTAMARQRDALLALQRAIAAGDVEMHSNDASQRSSDNRLLAVAAELAMKVIERATGVAIEMVREGPLRSEVADSAVEGAESGGLEYRAASGSLAEFVGHVVRRENSLSGLVLEQGRPLLCDDSETDPRVDRDACRQVHARSLLVVPVARVGASVCLLKYVSTQPQAFSESDVLAAQLAAGAIATGLSSAAEARATDAMLQSEARFRQLAETVPQMVWVARADGVHEYFNRRWYEFTGMKENFYDREGRKPIFHPEDRDRAWTRWEHSLATGEPYEMQYRLRGRDGNYRWTLGRALPVRNAAGQIERWFGTCTDIDLQVRATEALRQSREQQKMVVEGASVGVWYCPLPFDRLIWDETVKKHFFIPADQEVTIELFYSRLHPADRERTRQAIDASIANRTQYDIDYRTVSPEDPQQVKWIRAIGRGFYGEAGDPTRFDGITIDVTERRRAEQRLRESESRHADILRTSLDCLIGIDHLGFVNSWNPAAEQTLGWSASEAIGQELAALIIPHSMRDAHRAGLANYLKTREGNFLNRRLELSALARQGREIPVELTITAATMAEPPVFTAFLRDISARKEAEAERERLLEREQIARAQAEHASRMKDEFLATLSHEIRTPLNAILGWSQIMRQGRDPEDIAQGLDVIERNARAQAQIIEDLLDMSRIISGKVRLDVQRIDLASIVQSSVETARPAAEAKGVRIQAIIDPLVGVIVSGDANRLQQVMWNLLSNAVKFTPRDGRVQVLLERVNSHLELSVADTGEGIEPHFLPYVFDRFRQQDASTTRRHGGLGLGLSIVKQLVELHGGSIRASSAGIGKGSTFNIALPLIVVRHETHATSGERRHPVRVAHSKGLGESCVQIEGVRVLVVDDEPDARNLLKRVLEDCQAAVTAAASADEVIEYLKRQPFDVLISDIGMPFTDGYALIARVRQLPSHENGGIPAIALTAYARAEDRVKAVAAGFNMHVAKPVESVELITMVAGAAGRTGQSAPR